MPLCVGVGRCALVCALCVSVWVCLCGMEASVLRAVVAKKEVVPAMPPQPPPHRLSGKQYMQRDYLVRCWLVRVQPDKDKAKRPRSGKKRCMQKKREARSLAPKVECRAEVRQTPQGPISWPIFARISLCFFFCVICSLESSRRVCALIFNLEMFAFVSLCVVSHHTHHRTV